MVRITLMYYVDFKNPPFRFLRSGLWVGCVVSACAFALLLLIGPDKLEVFVWARLDYGSNCDCFVRTFFSAQTEGGFVD